MAKQLAEALGYSQYRHFTPVVERAREVCLRSGHVIEDHIEDILTMVPISSGAQLQQIESEQKKIKKEP